MDKSFQEAQAKANRVSQVSSTGASVYSARGGPGSNNEETGGVHSNQLSAGGLYSHDNSNLSSGKSTAAAATHSSSHSSSKKRYSIFRKSDNTVGGQPYEESSAPNQVVTTSIGTDLAETSDGPLSFLRRKRTSQKNVSSSLTSSSDMYETIEPEVESDHQPSQLYEYGLTPPVIDFDVPRYSFRSSSIYSELNVKGSSETSPVFIARKSSNDSLNGYNFPPTTLYSRPVSLYSLKENEQSSKASNRQPKSPRSSSKTRKHESPTPSVSGLSHPLQSYPTIAMPSSTDSPPRISFHLNRSSGLFSPNDLFGPGGGLNSRSSFSLGSNFSNPGFSAVPPVPQIPTAYKSDIQKDGYEGQDNYRRDLYQSLDRYKRDGLQVNNGDNASTKSTSTYSAQGLAFLEEYGAIINQYNNGSMASRSMSVSSSVGSRGRHNSPSQPIPQISQIPQIPSSILVKQSSAGSASSLAQAYRQGYSRSFSRPLPEASPTEQPISPAYNMVHSIPKSVTTNTNTTAPVRTLAPAPTVASTLYQKQKFDLLAPLPPITMSPVNTPTVASVSAKYADRAADSKIQSPTASASSSGVFSVASDYHSALSHQDHGHSTPSPPHPPMPQFPPDIDMPQYNVELEQHRQRTLTAGTVRNNDSDSGGEGFRSDHSSWMASQRQLAHQQHNSSALEGKKKRRRSRKSSSNSTSNSTTGGSSGIVASSRSLENVKYEKMISTVPPVASEHASIVEPGSPGSSIYDDHYRDRGHPVPPMPVLSQALRQAATGGGLAPPMEEEYSNQSASNMSRNTTMQYAERRGSLVHRHSMSSSIFQNRTPSVKSDHSSSVGSRTPFGGKVGGQLNDPLALTSSPGMSFADHRLSVGSANSTRRPPMLLSVNKRLPMVPPQETGATASEIVTAVPVSSQGTVGAFPHDISSMATTPRLPSIGYSTPSHTPPTPPPAPSSKYRPVSGGSGISSGSRGSSGVHSGSAGRPNSGGSGGGELQKQRRKRKKRAAAAAVAAAGTAVGRSMLDDEHKNWIVRGPPSAPAASTKIKKLNVYSSGTGADLDQLSPSTSAWREVRPMSMRGSRSSPHLGTRSGDFLNDFNIPGISSIKDNSASAASPFKQLVAPALPPVPVLSPKLFSNSSTTGTTTTKPLKTTTAKRLSASSPGQSPVSSKSGANQQQPSQKQARRNSVITSPKHVSPLSALERQHQKTLQKMQQEQKREQDQDVIESTEDSTQKISKKSSHPVVSEFRAPSISSPSTPRPPSMHTIHVYQVVHEYTPTLEDELLLRKGDQLVIAQAFDDDWCLACLVALAGHPTDAANVNRLVEGVCPKVCLSSEPVLTYTKPSSAQGQQQLMQVDIGNRF